MTEEEKRREQDKKNREQLLLALLLLMNPKLDETTITSTSDIDPVLVDRANYKLDEYLKKDSRISDLNDEQPIDVAKLTKSEILTTAQDIANVKSKYYKVVTVGDNRVCDKCKAWNGKIISDDDPNYPSYYDLEKSGSLHKNCRCYLKPVEKKAMNSENINDEIVCPGFVENTLINGYMEENIIKETIDNGIVENVHISPIGDFTGSKQDGSPQNEHITAEALSALADKMNAGDEVLCDVDHQSCRPGVEKDTSAAGWFTKFVVDPIKGLFASLKLTKRGKDLLANREYRYMSPTFMLNENGEPIDIHSVSLTNTPAFKGFINPVINSESTPIDDANESITNMTKEELVNLIKDTVVEMNSCSNKNEMEVKNEVVDQKKEEMKALIEEILAEKAKEKAIREIKEEAIEDAIEKKSGIVEVIDACGKKDNTVKNETVVEDPKEQEKKVEEKKEVIKEEALNSAPTIGSDISGKNEWENLHGKEFWTWYKKNNRNYR